MSASATSISSAKQKGSKQHCCVPLCNSNSQFDASLSFHHFPSDEELRKQWIIKIRRDEGPLFKVTKSTVVCSKHFKKDDYSGWTPVLKKLKKSTIPTVFDWSAEKTPRRSITRKVLSEPADKITQWPRQAEFEDEDQLVPLEIIEQVWEEEQALETDSDMDIPSEGNDDEDETDGDDEGNADDINQLVEMQQEILRLLHENAADKVRLTSMFYAVLDKLNEYQ